MKRKLRGRVSGALAGKWSTKTMGVVTELVLDYGGRFRWTMHGCTGTTYWIGEARRVDDELLLVPDKPDWMFTGGRILDANVVDGEMQLIARPRSADDRSDEFPFFRIR